MSWYDNIFDWGTGAGEDGEDSGSSSPNTSFNLFNDGTGGGMGGGGSSSGGFDVPQATGGGLGDLFKQGFKAFNNSPIPGLIKAGIGAYDYYNRGKVANDLKNQMGTLQNMYAPGTPEAERMKHEMEVKDAAAGRRSQYGTRATELASRLATQRGNILNSPNYLNLQAAYAAQKNGRAKSLADMFGALTKTKFADGGIVGGASANAGSGEGGDGDENSIQWKGTYNGLGPEEMGFLQSLGGSQNLSSGNTYTPLFNSSWKFDDGRKEQFDQDLRYDDNFADPTDEQISAMNPMNPNGGQAGRDAAAVSDLVTGRGDATLADFWQGTDPTALGDAVSQANTVNSQRAALAAWQKEYGSYVDSIQRNLNRAHSPSNQHDYNEANRLKHEAEDQLRALLSKGVPEGATFIGGYNPRNYGNPSNSAPTGHVDYSQHGGQNGSYDVPGFGGFSGSGGGGGDYLSLGGGSFFADGGHVPGHDPLGQDDVAAQLTRGEYVLPVDVVDKIGKHNLDRLVDLYHKPKGR